MNTWNFTSVEHFMVSTQREGLYGKMEHDVLLVEISERSGRKQSARVLLSTLRSMGMKYVTEVGVAQAESVTRAIVPSKIQLVRVDLNIPGYRDVVTNIGDEIFQRHTKKLGHRDEPGKRKKSCFPRSRTSQYSKKITASHLNGKVLLQHDVRH